MRKHISIILLALATATSLFAADLPEGYLPQKGNWAFGMGVNLVSSIKAASTSGSTSNSIVDACSNANSMQYLVSDPMASFSFKYMMTDKWAFRGLFGFSGMHLNQRDFVLNDVARFKNPLSNEQVYDCVSLDQAYGSVHAGFEYMVGVKRVKFTFGGDVVYSFGGGSIHFAYGNAITELNQTPTCTAIVNGDPTDASTFVLNEWSDNGDIHYARPVKRYNAGVSHGLGLRIDLGLECFVAERLSIGGKVAMTPIMFAWQPKTYTTYEGWSTYGGKVINNYNVMVSPGSNYLIYGTDNFGVEIGIHYYF